MCEAVSKALTPTLSESLIAISELHIPVLLCVGLKENRDFLVISAFLKKRCDTQDTAHITRATGASVPSFSPDEL